MVINSASCVDGSGDGTRATMPMHIWLHSVELTAIRHGASVAGIASANGKLVSWFNAGEPVWMAVGSLLQLAAGYDRAQREQADGFAHIRRAARLAR
jgi:hypothetical protein